MRKTTYNLIKNNEIYHRYKKRTRDLEKNMTNRTPSKLGLYCRFLRVSGKKGDNEITCDYGQDPDLKECVECYGLVYNNNTLDKLEARVIGVKKEMKIGVRKNPDLKEWYEGGIKFNEDKIIEYLEISYLKFIQNTNNI